jgi:hypothetical protein
MKHRTCIFLAVVMLAATSSAQTAPALEAQATQPSANQERLQKTAGRLNGRFWATMDETSKLYFLTGFREALRVAGVEDAGQARYLSGATFGEIVTGLDQFYKDPANAAIPAMDAIEVFASKVKGATPESLAQQIAMLRSLAAEFGHQPPGGSNRETVPVDLKDLGAVPVSVH